MGVTALKTEGREEEGLTKTAIVLCCVFPVASVQELQYSSALTLHLSAPGLAPRQDDPSQTRAVYTINRRRLPHAYNRGCPRTWKS